MEGKDDQVRALFETSICKSKSNYRDRNKFIQRDCVLASVFCGLPELKKHNASADDGSRGAG